jgi:hypothetical protein
MIRCVLLCCLMLGLLAGCARRAAEIEPLPAPPQAFAGANCMDLVALRAKRSQALIFLGMAQDQLSEDDSTRTLGVPTPHGVLFGTDREPDIAALKGELHALNRAMRDKGCIPDYR